MIDRKALLTDLKIQVRMLEDDLRERAGEVGEFDARLRTEWQAARDAKRLAATYESWLDERITQSAVAWVLSMVFVRFCEDNRLIDLPYLSGPGERLAVATERQQAFFERLENRQKTDREWIEEGFTALSDASAVAAGLFDRGYNPMWQVTPSLDASKTLIAFWRTRGDDGEIVHDFTDDTWNTRFLGDLYQDLSESARKTYALLQTPEFVEEFILDLILDPAIEEFGLDAEPPNNPIDLPNGLRLIDPTCGSGHFLLGAFKRLLKKWEEKAPGAERWDLINRALYSVHGVDKNPSAIAIARFRLLLAAMQAGGVKHLNEAPDFVLNLAVGDSLIHGRGASGQQGEFDLFRAKEVHTYTTEDVGAYMNTVAILAANTYHAVVGNPPYITVKDKQENENYRKAYKEVCSGKYALSVPFAERFFHLARRAGGDRRNAGHVGQITANSFMKREFGKRLIEDFFARNIDLTHIIDTSGAYIPGHGTPTAILIGRNMMPTNRTIRTIMGIRGEPKQPNDPSQGQVWKSITNQIHKPGTESKWTSSSDAPRDQFSNHPWTLSGGGAVDLLNTLESAKIERLNLHLASTIGFAGFSANDEALNFSKEWHRRHHTPQHIYRPLTAGKDIKSWNINPTSYAIAPYKEDGTLLSIETDQSWSKHLWITRRSMEELADFSGNSRRFSDTPPWTWYHWIPARNISGTRRIVIAKIATHAEAAVNDGDTITNQHVFVIQLIRREGNDLHPGVVAILNSSTACFWLKQVSHNRGNEGYQSGIKAEMWERFYEFTATKLREFPLPNELPSQFGNKLNSLAQRLNDTEPSATSVESISTREWFDANEREQRRIRGQMIAEQEELDWEVYRLYGLLTDQEAAELRANPEAVPVLKLGERAFEIVLARKMAVGEIETQWFVRHGSTPITELPAHWSEAYKRVVEKRIEKIERLPRTIGLIERPEYKRRWQSESWEKKEKAALRNWLLDRCEERALWFAAGDMDNRQPQPMTVNRLADRLRGDADFVSVARLYAETDAELADVLAEIIETEHVPHLAALRYKDTGLRKRAQWEDTWEKQREEDATGERLDIPVPPKYTSADFLKNSYWRNRGKLDVPKERFISYPGSSPDGDGSLLLGWAGWDHREQAHALMTVIEERSTRDGWERDRLISLIAGLAEVLPWVRQWHGEVDPAFGMSPAAAYAGYLEDQQLKHRLSAEDLTGWRPPKRGRGRKKTTSE